MSYVDDTFQIIIDKGTLDALISTPKSPIKPAS